MELKNLCPSISDIGLDLLISSPNIKIRRFSNNSCRRFDEWYTSAVSNHLSIYSDAEIYTKISGLGYESFSVLSLSLTLKNIFLNKVEFSPLKIRHECQNKFGDKEYLKRFEKALNVLIL